MYQSGMPAGTPSALGMSAPPRIVDVLPPRFVFSPEGKAVYNRANLAGQMTVALVPGDTIPVFDDGHVEVYEQAETQAAQAQISQ